MTVDQMAAEIIELYNTAVVKMADAENKMDHHNKKIAERAGCKFSEAIAAQEAIDSVLNILGYSLILDDENFAVGIAEE